MKSSWQNLSSAVTKKSYLKYESKVHDMQSHSVETAGMCGVEWPAEGTLTPTIEQLDENIVERLDISGLQPR